MNVLNLVKQNLRISADNTDFDNEIIELMYQSLEDLIASGVKPDVINSNYSDPVLWDYEIDNANIRRAVVLYCKTYFGIENTDKEWFSIQYLAKKAEIINQRTQFIDVGESNV